MPDAARLVDALKDNLSPEAAALIAAKCQPLYARSEGGRSAEHECAWFAQQLIDMLGTEEYEAICDELMM
ncbi:MAG: hypothetical protein WD294_12150 [Phycisphaeraceae bacterium]